MQRCLWSLVLCGTGLIGLGGCATLFPAYGPESRIITSAIESLKKADLEGLEKITSSDFQSAALRRKDAADAFKILNFPTGDVEVISVKEDGPDEKRVLASVGDKNKKRKIYCDLVRDPETKRWVVDDLELKRQLKPGQVNKSVTEQMELLLSIQEFIDAWEGGDREKILASCTPELRKTLEVLPEPGLKKFSTKIVADLDRKRLKPQVEGHANIALVRLPTKAGEILTTLHQVDGRWVADDLALQSRKDGTSISSLRKQAQVMHTAMLFCNHYRAGNKDELAKVCVPRFYRLNLQPSELSQVPLPTIDLVKGDIEIKLLMTQADVLLKQDDEIIQLMLTQGRPEFDDDGRPVDPEVNAHKPFLVEEVTLHELKSKQDKRLSSLFTSQALVQRFALALVQRDLKAIRAASTSDFNTRVWKRVELDNMSSLPLEAIESRSPQIIDTQFQGSLTEVTVNQGSTPLTYVLRDQAGTLMVDDVLTPALDRPNSLKQTLEVVVPMNAFRDAVSDLCLLNEGVSDSTARAAAPRNMDLVRGNSSREFNKLVFSSMSRIPKLKVDPSPYLDSPVTRIQLTADRALLILGDDRHGAKVFMNKENEKYVVDDVVLIGGLEKVQRTGLKQALRQLVIGGTQIGTTKPKIQQAIHESDSVDETPEVDFSSKAPVQNADYTE